MAYSNLALLRLLDLDLEETLRWGNRAIALAQELGETETLVHALNNVGSARYYAGDDQGHEDLERSLQLAIAEGLFDHAARALGNLAFTTMLAMRLDEADRRLDAAIAFAIEHDLDFRRGYLLATRAALRARQGRWDAAETEIRQLLRQLRLSPVTRMMALATLGQVLARRGSSEAAATLDEALAMADRTGKLLRMGPVRASRAEAALLNGDNTRAREEALAVRDFVLERGNAWDRGELAWLLWQAGDRDVPTDNLAEPYALQLAGDYLGAATAWRELGCPYEEACALAESEDPDLVRQAAAIFERARSATSHRARDPAPPRARHPRPASAATRPTVGNPRWSRGLDHARAARCYSCWPRVALTARSPTRSSSAPAPLPSTSAPS